MIINKQTFPGGYNSNLNSSLKKKGFIIKTRQQIIDFSY